MNLREVAKFVFLFFRYERAACDRDADWQETTDKLSYSACQDDSQD